MRDINFEAEIADGWTTHYFKRSFNGGDMDAIYERSKGCCVYCRKRVPRKEGEFDHLFPWKMGGASVVENGVYCCKSCNRLKAWRFDRKQAFDVAGLFFRKVHKETLGGPAIWGDYTNPKPLAWDSLKGGGIDFPHLMPEYPQT